MQFDRFVHLMNDRESMHQIEENSHPDTRSQISLTDLAKVGSL